MKNLFAAAFLLLLAVILVTPGFAQKPKSKDDAFREIVDLTKTKKTEDQDKAYELSKGFLTRFGKDKDDNVKKVKTFYDNVREHKLYVALEGSKFADAFSFGKEILAEQPENTGVLFNLAYAGYNAQVGGDKSFVDDSISFARRAVQLLEAGKLPKTFAPFKDQAETTAFMYFVDGKLNIEKDPKNAIGNIYKATLLESSVKTSPAAYNQIAVYYEDIYARSTSELKVRVDAKTINAADLKIENEKIGKVIDLMLDAYVRTYKRSDPKMGEAYEQIKQRLTQVYNFRKHTDEGLKEFIEFTNTTPMPDPSKY
jgi:hypothetical protein